MPVKSKETTINMNMTEENPICDIKMNVTEKQKQIIINFMREHPDFGKGKLRYNRCNKSIMVSVIISYVLLLYKTFL